MFYTKILATLVFFICAGLPTYLACQDIYCTPSGQKYHLSTCRMVVNVSKKLVGADELAKSNLEPCKICQPPSRMSLVGSQTGKNKSVGESAGVQCKGITKEGKRCLHSTRMANGFCYQHTDQEQEAAPPLKRSLAPQHSSGGSSVCGAKTQSGAACQRKVSGGGRCWQHD